MIQKKWSVLLAAGMILSAGAYENFKAAFDAGKKAKGTEAVAAFTEALKLAQTPDQRYNSYYQIGSIQRGLKELDQAVDSFRKAAAVEKIHYGQKATALFVAGDILQGQKKNAEALEVYKAGSEVTPMNWASARSLVRIGEIQRNAKKYDDAEKAILPVSRSPKGADPGSVILACIGLSQIAVLRDNNPEKAFAALDMADKALKEGKDFNGYRAQVLKERGDLFIRQKKYEDAIGCYLRIPAAPEMDSSWAALGYSRAAYTAHYQLKDSKRAVEYLDKAVALKSAWGYDKGLHAIAKKAMK